MIQVVVAQIIVVDQIDDNFQGSGVNEVPRNFRRSEAKASW